jgi:hypothetical protein
MTSVFVSVSMFSAIYGATAAIIGVVWSWALRVDLLSAVMVTTAVGLVIGAAGGALVGLQEAAYQRYLEAGGQRHLRLLHVMGFPVVLAAFAALIGIAIGVVQLIRD